MWSDASLQSSYIIRDFTHRYMQRYSQGKAQHPPGLQSLLSDGWGCGTWLGLGLLCSLHCAGCCQCSHSQRSWLEQRPPLTCQHKQHGKLNRRWPRGSGPPQLLRTPRSKHGCSSFRQHTQLFSLTCGVITVVSSVTIHSQLYCITWLFTAAYRWGLNDLISQCSLVHIVIIIIVGTHQLHIKLWLLKYNCCAWCCLTASKLLINQIMNWKICICITSKISHNEASTAF